MRGKGEFIRLVLAHFQLKYTEKNPTSLEEALALTRGTGFDFPNLPYLIDGDIRITESSAIPMYLALKAGDKNFFGKEGLEQVKHQMLIGVFNDLQYIFIEIFKSSEFEAIFEAKKDTLHRKFQELSQFKGERKFFFEQVTFADIAFFVIASFFEAITKGLNKPSLLAELPNLKSLMESVASLPGIKDYLENSPSAKLPIILPHVSKFPFPHN